MEMIEKDTVIVTETGNIIAKAGDLVNAIGVGTVVNVIKNSSRCTTEKNRDLRYVETPERLVIVNKRRVEPVSVNMDGVLPMAILQRRKKLIKQRMEQERMK